MIAFRTAPGSGFSLLVLFALLVGGGPALSDDFYVVDTTTDEMDGSCDDEDCSLRDAMSVGDGSVTVVVPAGTYTLDTAMYGAISIDDSRIVLGDGAGMTIIEGHASPGMASSGVFDIDASDTEVTFLGVTIRHGAGDDGSGIYWYGYGQLNLVESEVVYNDADSSLGGGIYFETTDSDYDSQLTLIETVVSNNAGFEGGGIYVYDSYGSAVVSLDGTMLEENNAEEGGGLYWYGDDYGGSLSLSDSTLSDNTATAGRGGGIYVYSDDYMDLKIRGSTFERNAAEDGGGGAVYVDDNDYGSLVVIDSTFRMNTAAGDGGAIYDNYSNTVLIDGCTFDQNEANPDTEGGPSYGGGVYLDSGYTMLVKDTLFTGNSAGFGGGLYSSMQPSLVTGSTFTTNSATDSGGGIQLGGFDLQLADTTLLNNTTGNLGPACFTPSMIDVDSLGGNRIDYLDDCMFDAEETDVIPEPASFLLQVAVLASLGALSQQRRRARSRRKSTPPGCP